MAPPLPASPIECELHDRGQSFQVSMPSLGLRLQGLARHRPRSALRCVERPMENASLTPEAPSTDELATLRALVEGTARNTGQEFFQSLVRHLAAAVE